MPIRASIIVPTRDRADYLEVALASIMPQARSAGAEVAVVDDGDQEAVRRVAERFGARYLSHPRPRGLNAARNTGIGATDGDLLVFVDDDVEVHAGWLAALLEAAERSPGHEVLGGPIRACLEDARLRFCGREGPPITALDLGDRDREAEFVWGANFAVRRPALDRIGPFDAALDLYGDEEDWQRRYKARGGRVLYVAAAGLDHRRAPPDARLSPLARAAYRRGRNSRRYDVRKGSPPTLAAELRTLAGCGWHALRRRCANGILLGAHTAGRVVEALDPQPAGEPDFLSGQSGTVGGRRAALLGTADAAMDAGDVLSGRRARLARAARRQPPRSVLVLGVDRPDRDGLMARAVAELRRSRHEVRVAIAPEPGGRGKFENLNLLLGEQPAEGHDWLLVIDDDVALPRGFLDEFLFLAERFQLALAQPAHRRRSHAAWSVTRRRLGSVVRETAFVEIGPVTALHARTFATLLPFPPLRMGWGLDVHWAALARERGWKMGVVDAVAVAHLTAPVAEDYRREEAVAEARAFLDGRPYLPRDDAQRTLVAHRSW
ncbi:MAG: glycosyltransferase [Solirubrobacteraceae bacterium]